MFWRITTFIGFGLTAGAIGMWASERTAPVDIKSTTVLTPAVRPGGDLCIRYQVFRRENCRTRLQRIVLDAARVRDILDEVELWSAPGPLGDDEYTTCMPIKTKLAPGPATYRAVTEYVCNPVHRLWPIVRAASEVHFSIEGPQVPGAPLEVVPRR